jgi:hypothetical protein
MPHAAVDNRTPFACEHLFLADEEGRTVLVVLVQATFSIVGGAALVLAEKQVSPSVDGEVSPPDPPRDARWSSPVASYRIEPAFAFVKPATDVVLLGHAQAGGRPVTDLQVTFRVGPVGKTLLVVGDRFWVKASGATAATRPQPFIRMPIVYERAFGGWDRSHPDPARYTFEARNPVGVGFRSADGRFEEGLRLPNIEDPSGPLQRFGQVVAPAGVGFVSPDWQPRASFAGTYDERWMKERMPLLPADFDRRFFNAASPGLVAPGYLAGDEPVLVDNASPGGRLSFRLPGWGPPGCRVVLRERRDVRPELKLDTVVVDADLERVLLLYRGHVPLPDGPHDVRAISVEGPVAWGPGQAPHAAAVRV